jgi:hypothetical protein
MSPADISKRVVALLNSAFQADREAIHLLVCNRVPCNRALRDHPDIVVDESRAVPGGYTVGLLGIVNGILHDLDAPQVELRWEGDTTEVSHRCIGFGVHTPEDQVSTNVAK